MKVMNTIMMKMRIKRTNRIIKKIIIIKRMKISKTSRKYLQQHWIKQLMSLFKI